MKCEMIRQLHGSFQLRVSLPFVPRVAFVVHQIGQIISNVPTDVTFEFDEDISGPAGGSQLLRPVVHERAHCLLPVES